MEKLQNHSFHGNLRELKAIVELAVVLAKHSVVDVEDIVIQGQSKQNHLLLTEKKTMEAYQNEIIFHYMEKYKQKVLVVADKLQISKSSIYNLLKRETKGKDE
jgi:DNA-binding NtrC family response regulator